MRALFDSAAIRAILLDIEGTTTPVTFVYDVLFPYARARLREFLHRHGSEPGIVEDMRALREKRAREAADAPAWKDDSPGAFVESAAAFALWLMDGDRKSTPLKSLQGKIWEAGYRAGALRGEVYRDVPPALAHWRKQGRRIAIFSSGSVLAQKLLFAHSTAGDLTPLLDAHFDTSTGPKREAESYGRIAAALTLPPAKILFVSDVTAELDAAHEAGMTSVLCVRPAKSPRAQASPAESPSHPVIHTFDELCD